jgi:Ca2+-binding RTX toxin-like protein
VLGYSVRSFADGTTTLFAQALGSDGTWAQLGSGIASSGTGVDPQGVAGDGSVPYVSGLRGGELLVSRFAGGSWESIDSPSASATSALLEPGSTGGVWLLFGESSGASTTYYLDTLGATLPADGGPVPGPPEPPPSGHCARTINGTAGNDRVTGTHLGDSLYGFGGNDALLAFAGSDCLFGGSGNDYQSGAAGNDFLSGGPGNDELRGGSGDDDLNGGSGNDVIVGGRGEDTISAGSGNDRIYVAAQGADLVDCGPGRDTVVISRIDGYRNCEKVIIKR